MAEQTVPYLSFIVRCRRAATGEIHGWLVDVYTGQSHAFRSITGLVENIERYLPEHTLPGEDTPPGDNETADGRGGNNHPAQ